MKYLLYYDEESILYNKFIESNKDIINKFMIIGDINLINNYDVSDIIIITKNIDNTTPLNYKLIRNYKLFDTNFYHYSNGIINNEEINYLNLIYKILTKGELKQTRNAEVYSVFDKKLKFNLNNLPLLTTKKMGIKGVIHETLMFLTGKTNVKKELSDNNVHIWDGNTNRQFLDSIGLNNYQEGDMGPMYGFQFYRYGEEYIDCNTDYNNKGFNQIEYVINLLLKDKFSRRIILTSFNPKQAKEGCLYPCHSLILQFYVNTEIVDNVEVNKLSLKCYNRSQDLFLGVPWNITYAALLVNIICKYMYIKYNINYIPNKLIIDMGDVHIYKNHEDACISQILRLPNNFPKININLDNNLSINDFKDFCSNININNYMIIDYNCMNSIKADMIA